MASQLTGFSQGTSASGARFTPFGRRGYEQGMNFALGQLPGLANNKQNFGDVLKEVGGPPGQFTDIPQSAYLTPQTLNEMTNSLFAQGAARTGAMQENIREGAIPGATSRFGLTEHMAGAQRFNDALAQREATRLRGEYAPTINRQAAIAQTNVEAQRAGDDRNRRALALARLRDDLSRENALLSAIARFGQPLPFSRNQHTSVQYAPDNSGPSMFDLGGPWS